MGNGDYTEITTPFLDRHNDYIQIYARQRDEQWELTDDGYTLLDLQASGCDVSSKKRSKLLEVTLRRLGVTREGHALTVRAGSDDFPQKKHDLVQAMLAVGDLFHTASATVFSLFLEEVSQWLDEHDVRYVEDAKFTGTSGYSHHFDFVIPGHRDVPERMLEAINRPNRSTIVQFIMAWEDIREVRPANARALAVLNDADQTVPQKSLQALSQYDIIPVRWTQRDRYVEELAA